MATDIDDSPSGRRLRLRRTARPGLGGASGATRSESLRDSDQEHDEIDDAIDPEQVVRHVRGRAAELPPPLDPGPAQRLQEVANAGSRSYAKEHRLTLLHRFLNRGIGLDKIAQQLGVSISTLEKDRVELKKRLREEARALHVDEMVGGQTALYDDIAGMALRIASFEGSRTADGQTTPGNPLPMRLAAMRTALAANADKNRFYVAAGVYDVHRFRRAEDGSGQSDVQLLMQQTREMLESLSQDGGFSFSDAPDSNDDLSGPLVTEL